MYKNEDTWTDVLSKIEQQLKPVIFFTWFKDTKLINLTEGTAVIEVPYNTHKKMLKENYDELIKETFMAVTGQQITTEYILTEQNDDNIFDKANIDKNMQSTEQNDKEKTASNIFDKFEKEFGRTLSPMEYEIVNSWIRDTFDENTIELALKEASDKGLLDLKYIDKILHEYNQK